jgi:hypothetical protein
MPDKRRANRGTRKTYYFHIRFNVLSFWESARVIKPE